MAVSGQAKLGPKAQKWWDALFVLVCVTLALQVYDQFVPWGFRAVVTKSIPVGLYTSRTFEWQAISRGQHVCFTPRMPAWASERNYHSGRTQYCKEVLAVGGDQITLTAANHVEICTQTAECRDAGLVKDVDSKGRPLHSAFPRPTTVPAGYVYVGGLHAPNSLDSRYFGLVPISDISALIWPVWTPT